MQNREKKRTFKSNKEPQLRIAVKFKIPPRNALKALSGLSGFGKLGRNLRVPPLIESFRARQLISKVSKIDAHTRLPDFSLWYRVICPAEVHPDELASALRTLEIVETAYVMRPAPPPVNRSNRNPIQRYLDPAPNGIDALYAWDLQRAGCDGAGIGFVDMEQGWDRNHVDLPAGIKLISGNDLYSREHGTAVLGVVLMVDNADRGSPIGGLGIAPAASGRVVSQWRTKDPTDTPHVNIPDAIVDAVAHMSFGDVLLLEAQEEDPATVNPTKIYPYYWPVEVADATYEAVLLATALGMVVVEAAANGPNGANNLNEYTTKPPSGNGKRIFDRTCCDFRDSGAIMVGAAESAIAVAGSGVCGHERFPSSNYGNRIDCYAWGEGIYTTTTNGYRSDFGDTSGASAIVAGAALIVQGLAQASLGYRLSPRELRRILTKYGTPSITIETPPSTPAVIKEVTDIIGVMPNLEKIISGNEINLAPDLYLRDYVGDIGDPTTGIFSQSPDIIVRQAPIADPQGTYGQGSGTENDPALSEDVAAGQTNFIYVRVSNRGGSATTQVSVDLYWAPPATLVQPEIWQNNMIGTALLPSVPTGRVLTVSGAVTWTNPPGSGPYCFVAVAGSDEDPSPGIPVFQPTPEFSAFDQYLRFIDNNNNIASRNINIVIGPPAPAPPLPSPQPPSSPRLRSLDLPPPRFPDSPAGFYRMSFLIPGAFDTSHIFELEALGGLPEGSRAFLETPDWFADALRSLPCKIERNPATGTVLIPLNPAGLQRLGSLRLHAGTVAYCNLLVRIPEKSRKNAYEFAVRQLYNKREVGRVTWRFAALLKKNWSKKTRRAA